MSRLLCLLLLGCCLCTGESRVTGEHYQNVLTALHKAQMRTLETIISKGLCHHIYLDFGTNIGVQIRKLYQPSGYLGPPPAKLLAEFDKYFGPRTDEARRKVCAIGFEGNPVHTSRLVQLQEAYMAAGFPCVVFTETALGIRNGTVTFWNDPNSLPSQHEWGASTVSHTPNSENTTALSIDTNRFVHHIHRLWVQSGSFRPETSKLYVKMDVEGSEFDVVPDMLLHGSLCLVDAMMTEWHPHNFPNQNPDMKKLWEKIFWYLTNFGKSSHGCRFSHTNFHDESFLNDTDTAFPPPNATFAILSRRV